MNRTSIWLRRAAGITAAASLALTGLVATAATASADRGPTCTATLSAPTVGPGESLTLTITVSDDSYLEMIMHSVGPYAETAEPAVTNTATYNFSYDVLRAEFGADVEGGRYDLYPNLRRQRSSDVIAAPTRGESLCSAEFAFKKSPQTISFADPGDRHIDSGSFDAAATASSGMRVYFRTLTPAVCTVDGPLGRVDTLRGPVPSIVNLLTPGTCTLEASQYGDRTYAAAELVTRSFQVTTGVAPALPVQPVVPALPTKGLVTQVVRVLGDGESARVTASPASVCRIDGGNVVLVGKGTCTITVLDISGAVKRSGKVAVSYAKGAQPAVALEHVGAVYFAFNSAKLKPAAKATLRAKAASLRSAKTVVAYGNTHGPGKNGASSRRLARARATAVVRYLSTLGVKAQTLTVASAMENPVSKKPAKNRRVDLYVAR